MAAFDPDMLLTRDASHPSELELEEWVAGLLPAERAAEVARHVESDEASAAFVAELREGLAAVPGLDADAAFEAIWARASEPEPAAVVEPERESLWDRLRAFFDVRTVALVAVGAAAAVAFFTLRPTPPAGLVDAPDQVRMKGQLSLELARKTDEGAQPMVSGDIFDPDDEVRFIATLPEAGEVRIVGVEASGELYTAWPLPGHGAEPRRSAGKAQELPGAVQFDGQPGKETLHLVLCPDGVEPTCSSAGPGATPKCPEGCRSTAFDVVKQRQ